MKKPLLFIISFLAVFVLDSQSVEVVESTDDVLILNASYIDVVEGSMTEDVDILIIDGVITDIGKGLKNTTRLQEIDAKGYWVMPGLIDAHIHMFQSGGLYTRPDAIDLSDIRSYDTEVKWLRDNSTNILESYARLGITSVVDMGGPMTNYQIREAISDSDGLPSYYCTGPLISTYQPDAFAIEDAPIVKVNTSDEGRQMVRDQLPFNPDFIKIWYIAGPGMPAVSNYNIVAETIDEAKKHDLKVAVHATQLNTAKLAVKAGADILVHSVAGSIDKEFIDMLLENEVILIPTLTVHGGYDLAFSDQLDITSHDLEYGVPDPIGTLLDVKHINHPALKEAQYYAPDMLSRNTVRDSIRRVNLKQLVESGVTIATGTDAGNIGTLHATSYIKELQAMSEAGLSNHDILKASTYGASRIFDRKNTIGKIEKGAVADLLILKSNPLEDLDALLDIYQVIKAGKIVNTQAVPSPEYLAQQQLNAYNLRDIDAFLKPYSDTVKIYNFPDVFQYQGKDKMREGYADFFKNTPSLHCELVKRIVLGNTVIDQEKVTGFGNDYVLEAVAIYKIKDGKIVEVYFDMGG